jgi:hypothetical protein
VDFRQLAHGSLGISAMPCGSHGPLPLIPNGLAIGHAVPLDVRPVDRRLKPADQE